jgi:hypothetical protein
MTRFFPRLATLLFLPFLSLPGWGAFHFFTINEVYSNPSGTVQYVELTALAGGQQFTAGHTLVSTSGTTRTYNITTNLPGDTSGRKMLFGTAGVQAAFGVAPDYVIPDGFLHTTTGSINWGEGSDIWNHPDIPTAGLAYNRDGSTSTPSPQNFAGVVGGPQAPAATYQALWWAFPAGSESGWGVNVTHQGDILFATWFTYDTDGNGMWLVMSDANRISEGVYSGQLYRTTGPPFNNFTPGSSVTLTAAGTATFTFTSPTRGTFAYSTGGVTQTKQIVRQEFATPVPTCTAGGTPGGAPNYQDLWWRSPAGSESGWGLNITHQGDILFGTWFTYGADGRGMWLVMTDLRKTTGETFTGPIYRTRGNPFSSTPFDPATVTVTPVGNATLAFTDANNGSFTYTVDGITQTKPITRQVFATPVSLCRTP